MLVVKKYARNAKSCIPKLNSGDSEQKNRLVGPNDTLSIDNLLTTVHSKLLKFRTVGLREGTSLKNSSKLTI